MTQATWSETAEQQFSDAHDAPFDAAAAAGPGQPRPKKVKRDDVIYFATQLAVMVDTGVPLPEALDSIAEQTEHIGLKLVVHDLSEHVKGGTSFSGALERHPRVFSRLFIALMRASEASGTMGQMLTRASEYMQQERDIRKKIKGAMTYPIVMLSFCVLVVIALLVFILPRFEKIYEGKDAVLPVPTRALLAMSNGIITYWPLILAGAILTGVGAFLFFRSPSGKRAMDKVRISLPVIGPMYRKAYLARAFRTMSTMVSTGVAMLDGLQITAAAAGNQFYAKVWHDVGDAVERGSSVSEELFEHDLVPRTVTQMISAGERSGRLAMVMDRVAKFCEEDLEVAVKTVTNMIEPIMIVVMGTIVGGIAMALLLPIFSISKVVAH